MTSLPFVTDLLQVCSSAFSSTASLLDLCPIISFLSEGFLYVRRIVCTSNTQTAENALFTLFVLVIFVDLPTGLNLLRTNYLLGMVVVYKPQLFTI